MFEATLAPHLGRNNYAYYVLVCLYMHVCVCVCVFVCVCMCVCAICPKGIHPRKLG